MKPAALHADDVRARERSRRRREPLWSLFSFAVHLLLFAVVVLLTPVKTLVFDRKAPKADPAKDLSADRIGAIAQGLDEARLRELVRKARHLQETLRQIDGIRLLLAGDYDVLATRDATDARLFLQQAVESVWTDQDRALAALSGNREEAVAHQAAAVNGLDRIQVRAAFAGYVRTAALAATLWEAQTAVPQAADQAEAQRELHERTRSLQALIAEETPVPDLLVPADPGIDGSLVAPLQDLRADQVYDLALRLEAAVTESYKDIKACEMAKRRKMVFTAAQRLTDVARPSRLREGLEPLAGSVRTKEQLDRRKALLATLSREAQAMVETTDAMLEDARRLTDPCADSQEERLARLKEESDYQVAIEAAAAEDDGAKAKDLTALMAGGGAVAAPEGLVSAQPKDRTPSDPAMPVLNEPDLVPGNRLNVGPGKGGLAAKWMYVNSWYVIGPFPNPGRINLRRKFAPETIQDLDATYEGKDGRLLRWEFVQANNGKTVCWWQPWVRNTSEVVPIAKEDFSIYYAYAEVTTDEACDRWIAIGSDDRSDVWINDIPVWSSSSALKPWRQAEDFRKVHLKKGRNRILIRVENGPADCGWSMCIATTDGVCP